MAINRTRLNDYLREMRSLAGKVSDTHFIDIFEERLIDALSRELINIDDIEFLRREVERLFNMDLAKFDSRIRNSYNEILELVNELYDDLGGDMSRATQQLRALEQVNRLQVGEYKDSTVEGIARAIQKGVIEDQSFKEIKEAIGKLDKRAKFHADAIANTQVRRYSRQTKWQKAMIGGVTIFLYAGGTPTRQFCIQCRGYRFSLEQIFKLRNRNLEPVYINCGGWRCIHELEPDPTAKEPDPQTEAIVAQWSV